MQATLKRLHPPDLHWLAFLLIGRRDQRVDVAHIAATENPVQGTFFESWMEAWSRRVAIAKALTGIRDEMAASKRRTSLRRVPPPALSLQQLRTCSRTTRSELEPAVLALDHFPRAVLVLTLLEGVSAPDCAVLLDSHPRLIHQALNIGLLELTHNLDRARAWRSKTDSSVILTEIQYA